MTTASDQHWPVIDRWAVAGLHLAIHQKALFTRPAWTSGLFFRQGCPSALPRGVLQAIEIGRGINNSLTADERIPAVGTAQRYTPTKDASTAKLCSMHSIGALSFAARGLVDFLRSARPPGRKQVVGSHTGRWPLRQTRGDGIEGYPQTDRPYP